MKTGNLNPRFNELQQAEINDKSAQIESKETGIGAIGRKKFQTSTADRAKWGEAELLFCTCASSKKEAAKPYQTCSSQKERGLTGKQSELYKKAQSLGKKEAQAKIWLRWAKKYSRNSVSIKKPWQMSGPFFCLTIREQFHFFLFLKQTFWTSKTIFIFFLKKSITCGFIREKPVWHKNIFFHVSRIESLMSFIFFCCHFFAWSGPLIHLLKIMAKIEAGHNNSPSDMKSHFLQNNIPG